MSERSDVDPQSRYGDPQHEATVGNDWEFRYYGESDGAQTPGPIEFVPGIEYRVGFEGDDGITGTNPPARPLSVSD